MDTAAVNIANQALFRSEYELEMENWLRRRFKSVGLCYIAVTALVLLVRVPMILANADPLLPLLVTIGAGVASAAALLHLVFAPHWATASRPQLLQAASTMILVLGFISLIKSYILEFTSPVYRTEFIVALFFWHFIACLFLPWTPRESLRPVVPLLVLWGLGVMLHIHAPLAGRITFVVLSPLVLLPGLGVCALRLKSHIESFRTRMVGKHFLSMRQEMMRARSIHESMFPAPHDDGFVRFEYSYTPMREIGGDYVHLHVGPEGLIHLTLMDVTGHGLAAALTVNRLYGELERIRAESPLAEPGEVLTLLNRYINLTMVRHNIFVTSLCITLDPYEGRLYWCSAGHPPAFLRGVNGVVTELPATAVLLGALSANEFKPDQRTMELSPGDVVLAYTDGAFETRDRTGQSMGLKNLADLVHVQPPPRNWAQFIASAVQKHSAGRPEDDILIAALTFKAPRTQPLTARRAVAAT